MTPWSSAPPGDRDRRSYATAEPRPFWLDADERASPTDPLRDHVRADLAIVGGGLSGLWAAVLAKEEDPQRDVVLLEADRVAAGATGRSGGFIVSSLTHGIANGMSRFPEEMPLLERLGRENFEQTVTSLERHRIDCDLELTGELSVALEPHEEAWLEEEAGQLRRLGHDAVLLDREAVGAELNSPLYRAGLWQRSGAGIVNPAKLAWGLAQTALALGVRLYEHTPVSALRDGGDAIELTTPQGSVRAARALLATGAFKPLLAEIRRRIVPVWDYVLVTEQLDSVQRAAIGWERRQGVGDVANQFHYYRLTADDRIL